MISVLFVCTGNICRSPALQAVLEELIRKQGLERDFSIDSCGTGGWFIGEEADQRMQEVARNRGIFVEHTARQFQETDFDRFTYIFAATKDVLLALKLMARFQKEKEKIYLATHFSHLYKDQDIPDPYFSGRKGFEHAMDMIEDSTIGILNFLIADGKESENFSS